MITESVANQKGGVGKSVISIHRCFTLSEQNKRTLFIDNDPQGNSGKCVLKNSAATKAPFETINLYSEMDFDFDNYKPSSMVTVLTADRTLANVARYDSQAPFVFKENLSKLAKHFDNCVMDNPPTLGLGLIASLVSSDFVYSPIELEDFSIEGLQDLMKTIEGVRSRHNNKLNYLGIIPNRLNSRDARQKEKFMKLVAAFPTKIIKAAIVQRGSISEALDRGLPVWEIQKEKSAAKQATIEMNNAMKFIDNKIAELTLKATA